MWLATVEAFAPRWTQDIHDEWIRNVLKDNPIVSFSQLERTRRLMDAVKPASLVSGYQHHIPALHLPDPEDRHVLAAAIEANASHIVTFNLSDFPDVALMPHNIRAVHPDYYLSALFDENAEVFCAGVQAHRAALKNPVKSQQGYIDTLRSNRLYEVAIRLDRYRDAF
jgi:predicted nucleic acid-binding protein